LIEISKGRKFDLHLRSLHELCSWGAKEGLQKLRHIYQVSCIIGVTLFFYPSTSATTIF